MINNNYTLWLIEPIYNLPTQYNGNAPFEGFEQKLYCLGRQNNLLRRLAYLYKGTDSDNRNYKKWIQFIKKLNPN